MPNTITHTMIIVGITCLISYIAFNNKNLESKLIFWSKYVSKGEYQRFITHGFIHANGLHLLFNMFTLFSFGNAIENLYKPYLGGFGFVVFYLVGIIVAMIPTFLAEKNNANYRSLGASGAVSAVLFAYILFAPWNMLVIMFIIPMPAIVFAILYVAYSIWAQKKGNDNINHSAHLWGGAYGIIVTIMLKPEVIPHFLNALVNPAF